eukprot:31431-Eustigmatos_ZCMA.PRE.1
MTKGRPRTMANSVSHCSASADTAFSGAACERTTRTRPKRLMGSLVTSARATAAKKGSPHDWTMPCSTRL